MMKFSCSLPQLLTLALLICHHPCALRRVGPLLCSLWPPSPEQKRSPAGGFWTTLLPHINRNIASCKTHGASIIISAVQSAITRYVTDPGAAVMKQHLIDHIKHGSKPMGVESLVPGSGWTGGGHLIHAGTCSTTHQCHLYLHAACTLSVLMPYSLVVQAFCSALSAPLTAATELT